MQKIKRRTTNGFSSAMRDALHVLGRPVRTAARRGHTVVLPYRGYGTRDEVFLMGRVFRQPLAGAVTSEGKLTRDLLNLLRRMLRWGIGDAVLKARFYGTEKVVTTDRYGYFHVALNPAESPPTDTLWHRMDLELERPGGENVRAEGYLFIPPHLSQFVVISDIDDTVVLTGVANKIKMMWRLFFQGAESRTAFPGVAAFYQALHRGSSGKQMNPMLYVSRGPWSIYDVLEAFFTRHRIPVGPILFLRDWGLTLQRPFPRKAIGHKYKLIEDMLSRYEDMSFILIGDSGQHDPEIYARVVSNHPGRVLAVYIRTVNKDPERRRAIENLAAKVVEAGASMLLAADTFAMAEHAADRGFISEDALTEVLEERVRELGEPALQPVQSIESTGPQEAKEALRQGPLTDMGEDTPPNVAIQPNDEKATGWSDEDTR